MDHYKMMKLINDCRQLVESQKKETMKVVCRYGVFKGIKIDLDDIASLQDDRVKATLIEKQVKAKRKLEYMTVKQQAREVEDRILKKKQLEAFDKNHNLETADVTYSSSTSKVETADVTSSPNTSETNESVKTNREETISENIPSPISSERTESVVTSSDYSPGEPNRVKKSLHSHVDPMCLMSLESVEFRDIAVKSDDVSSDVIISRRNTTESCSQTFESNETVIPSRHVDTNEKTTRHIGTSEKAATARRSVAIDNDSLDSSSGTASGTCKSRDIMNPSLSKKNEFNDSLNSVSDDDGIDTTVKSIQSLQRQQEQLDSWYQQMLSQIELEKIRMAEKYEELKLKNIREQKKLIDRSQNALDHPAENNERKESISMTPNKSGNVAHENSTNLRYEPDYYKKLKDRRKSRPVKYFSTPTSVERKKNVDFLNTSTETTATPQFERKETLTSTPHNVETEVSVTMDREKVKRSLMQTPRSPIDVVSKKVSPKTGDEVLQVMKEMSFQEKQLSNFHAILLTEDDIVRLRDILVSVIKGFLVRQLMKTSKVQNIIHTIKDTEICLKEMNKENGHVIDPLDRADMALKERLLDEVRVKRELLHDIFFKYTPHEQMKLLSQARKSKEEKRIQAAYQHKSSSPDVTVKNVTNKLSTASQRSMQRRKDKNSSTSSYSRPKTAPSTITSVSKKVAEKRPLRPLQTTQATKSISAKTTRPKTSDLSSIKTSNHLSNTKKPVTRKAHVANNNVTAVKVNNTKKNLKPTRTMAADFKKRPLAS